MGLFTALLFNVPVALWVVTIAVVVYVFYGVWIFKRGSPCNTAIRKMYFWMFGITILAFRDWAGKPVLEVGGARIVRDMKDGAATFELTNGKNQPVPEQKYFWPYGRKKVLIARWVNMDTLAPLDLEEIEKIKPLLNKTEGEFLAPVPIKFEEAKIATDDPGIRQWVSNNTKKAMTTPAYGFGQSGWQKALPIIMIAVVGMVITIVVYTGVQGLEAVAGATASSSASSASAAASSAVAMQYYFNISQGDWPIAPSPYGY